MITTLALATKSHYQYFVWLKYEFSCIMHCKWDSLNLQFLWQDSCHKRLSLYILAYFCLSWTIQLEVSLSQQTVQPSLIVYTEVKLFEKDENWVQLQLERPSDHDQLLETYPSFWWTPEAINSTNTVSEYVRNWHGKARLWLYPSGRKLFQDLTSQSRFRSLA